MAPSSIPGISRKFFCSIWSESHSFILVDKVRLILDLIYIIYTRAAMRLSPKCGADNNCIFDFNFSSTTTQDSLVKR